MYEENYASRSSCVGRPRPHAANLRRARLQHGPLPTILDALGQPDETLDADRSSPPSKAVPCPTHQRDLSRIPRHPLSLLLATCPRHARHYKYIFNAGDFDEVYDLTPTPASFTTASTTRVQGSRRAPAKGNRRGLAARTRSDADDVAKMFATGPSSGQFEASATPSASSAPAAK